MNRTRALWLVVALTSCSSPVTVTSSTTGGSGGAGGSAVSASNGSGTSTAGSGGAGGGFLVGASSASSSSSGAGGASDCTDTFVDVTGDGPTQHYTARCPWSLVLGNPTGPVAYIPMGGGIISQLQIEGCASSANATAGLSLSISNVSVPGTDTKATASYIDATAVTWASMGAGTVAVTVDVYEDVGGVVTGSYTAAVESQSATRTLSGAFRVCHEWEVPKP